MQSRLLFSIVLIINILCGEAFSALPHPSLYISFDDKTAEPVIASGSRNHSGPANFTNGVLNCGWISDGTPLQYKAPINLNVTCGTLSLWFYPTKSIETNGSENANLVDIPKSNFRLMINPTHFFFMTGNQLPGQDFKWDYKTQVRSSLFNQNSWNHIVVTWNAESGKKSIYINDVLQSSTETDLIRDNAVRSAGDALLFGQHPGIYDEICIWPQVLTEKEIQQLHQDIAPTVDADIVQRVWSIEPCFVNIDPADSVLTPGESFAFNLTVKNHTDALQKAHLEITPVDQKTKPMGETQILELTLQGKESVSTPMSVTPNRQGFCKIEVKQTVNGITQIRDITCFAILPAGNPPEHPFFGTHVYHKPGMIQLARRLGFSQVRVHNLLQFTWWARMEPERGNWTMKTAKAYDVIRQAGFGIYGQWFAVPYWAALPSNGRQPEKATGYPPGWQPGDKAAYQEYIRRSLQEFPAITEWEIHNEPYVSKYWFGSPEDYVDMSKLAYTAAKSARPDITVYSQLPTDGAWLDSALNAGALDYCDGVAFHAYIPDYQAAKDMLGALKKALAGHLNGRNLNDIPIVHSEGGVPGGLCLRGVEFDAMPPEKNRPPLVADEGAAMLVKSRVYWMSEGLRASYYYFFIQTTPERESQPAAAAQAIELTGGPRPNMVAHAVLVRMIDGGSFQSEDTSIDGLEIYFYQRKDGRTLGVLWGATAASGHIDLPEGTEVYDIMGNPVKLAENHLPVNNDPVYLLSSTGSEVLRQQLHSGSVITYDAPTETVSGEYIPKSVRPFPLTAEIGPQLLHPVSLAGAANMGFADEAAGDSQGGATDEGPFNDLRMLNAGTTNWLGVPMHFEQGKSIVTLRGKHGNTFGPEEVTIATTLSNVRGLFFAHGANWIGGQNRHPGQLIATYTIRYDDGSTETIPVQVGHNIEDWWKDLHPEEESRPVALKHPSPLEGKSPYRFIRLWYWPNPHTNKTIVSITVERNSHATFFLAGITAAVWPQ